MATNKAGLVGGHRQVQGPQPQGQLSNVGLQMNPGGNQHRAVTLGHQPPVWLAPPPGNNNLAGLQQVQAPAQQAPVQLPPLPQVPRTQVGGYNLANAPALQNAQRAPAPTFAASQQTQAALTNLRNMRDILSNADDIVQATHTEGSERFQPLENLLTQNKNATVNQALSGQLVQTAQAYIAQRGTTTSGPLWNRQTTQVVRPQATSIAQLKQELARTDLSSTAKKLMVADFVVREFSGFAQSTASVSQTVATVQPNGLDAASLKDLVTIARDDPSFRRTATNELLQGLARPNQQQVNQLVQQVGLGATDEALARLTALPQSQPRDQAIDALATAIASDPQLARAYVENGGNAEAIDKIFNGQGQNGYLTPLNTIKDMVSKQFKYEMPSQVDATLLRGRTPICRMLTSGLERSGGGYLSNISNQVANIIRQEVQQAGQAGTPIVIQNVGNPVVVDAILRRVMPLLNPQTTPPELQNFTRFVAASIDQAAHLPTPGNFFIKNGLMLRTINSSVNDVLKTGTPDERTMSVTVTAAIQRAVSGQGAFPAHDRYAVLNNQVATMAQPNSQLNQWLNTMV